jgi:cyanate permease
MAPKETLVAVAGWRDRLVRTLTTPGPWLIAFAFAVYTGQWMSVIGFLPTVYTQNQISWGMTGVLTALVALVNFSGNWMSGRLPQRGWSARQTMATGYVVMGLGAVGAFWDWGGLQLPFAARYACVVLFSAVGGLIPGTLFACAVRLAPSEDTVSTTVGWMQQWSATGQFIGPLVVAWLAGAVGGWQWTWVVTLSMATLGLVLALRIQKALELKTLAATSHG